VIESLWSLQCQQLNRGSVSEKKKKKKSRDSKMIQKGVQAYRYTYTILVFFLACGYQQSWGVFGQTAFNDTVDRGKADCPCIDSAAIMREVSNCVLDDVSEPGAVFATGGECLPLTYGSDFCWTHDLLLDPVCLEDDPPKYCLDKFCFVDKEKCIESSELFYMSDLELSRAQRLFYSYSTCNSTAQNWVNYKKLSALEERAEFNVTIPTSWFPVHFKTTPDGEVAALSSDEYVSCNCVL
jgi:hypothetical protein